MDPAARMVNENREGTETSGTGARPPLHPPMPRLSLLKPIHRLASVAGRDACRAGRVNIGGSFNSIERQAECGRAAVSEPEDPEQWWRVWRPIKPLAALVA